MWVDAPQVGNLSDQKRGISVTAVTRCRRVMESAVRESARLSGRVELVLPGWPERRLRRVWLWCCAVWLWPLRPVRDRQAKKLGRLAQLDSGGMLWVAVGPCGAVAGVRGRARARS